MPRTLRILLIFLLTSTLNSKLLPIFIGINCFAQQNNFKTYSIDKGLPQSSVYAIFQDSRGYLWLGMAGGGISRFDGINFKSFNKKDGLAGNFVRTIIQDSRGFLWIGTDEGISVYDGLKFTTIDIEKGLSNDIIIRLYEDAQNNIWVGTADGGLNKIQMFNRDSIIIETFTTENGLSSNFIFDIYEDKNNRLWLATYNGGINILTFSSEGARLPARSAGGPDVQGSTSRPETDPDLYREATGGEDRIGIQIMEGGIHIPGDQILVIEEDLEGNLWFGTHDAGAFKVITSGPDSGVVIAYNAANGLNDNTVWDILCDSKGIIWFATNDGGINKLEGTRFTAYTKQDGLPDNQILNVFEDHQGNIWMGTMSSGLCQFMGDHFAHYTEKEGLPNNQIYNINQDEGGNYWLASDGGLIRLSFSRRDSSEQNDDPIWTSYTNKDGLAGSSVTSLSIAPDGNIWIATFEGISKLAMSAPPKSFTNYSIKEGLADNHVNCIFVDSKGIVWCGTRGGISAYDGARFLNITEESGLINNEVQTIIEDRQGNIWFGTLDGLVWYDKKLLTNYDEVEGLINKRVYALAEDHIGNIWIGTFGGGLYKFNIHSKDSMPIQFISDDSLLGSNNIYSLIFQDENTLIIGTDKGFDKLIFNDAQNIIKVKNYNNSDGFIGVENNVNAIYKDQKGNIWFGTVNGVTRYNPAAEKINNEPPKTHITNLRLSFENVDWQSRSGSIIPWFNLPYSLNLPYSSNHLTFEFAGVSLSNPQKVLYKYQLEGLETGWSPTRKETEVIYSALPPGEYTFKVIAKNENGIWNSQPAAFGFTISPPFWQTWWFYLLCALVGISSIVGFIKVRERSLIKEKKVLEEKVKERTLELATKNKEITDSINYARHIQQAILPSLTAIERTFSESFIIFAPKDIVSGDFYWYTDKKGKVFIAACDCTGHGVPGAFVSMIGNNLLNQIILEKNIDEPGEILSMLNKGVKSAFTREGEQEAQDGMDMVLCCLTPLKTSTSLEVWTLQYAGANNSLYILRKDANSSEIYKKSLPFGEDLGLPRSERAYWGGAIIKGNKTPIGGDTDTDYNFTSHTIELQEGDTIYLISDGYQDQFGGSKNKKFTIKRLKQLFLNIQDNNMGEQKEILKKAFNDWKGDEEQVDDILVIGIRIGDDN